MTQSFQSVNPEYSEYAPDWILMRDSYKGQRAVKAKNNTYLPPTSSMILDGFGKGETQVGQIAYNAYKQRARFPNFVREAVHMALGMMHSQPPEIKLPKAMENIRSSRGETLVSLLERINKEQLITGRISVMADLPTNPSPDKDIPYLTTYSAERVINWDDGSREESIPQDLNLVVMNESEPERKDAFSWEVQNKHRILILKDGIYHQAVFRDEEYSVERLQAPSWKGNTLDKIPFVIINSTDLVSSPEDPPLLDLGNLCMSIYMGEADYRQNLFMQGQDTFVTIGLGADDDENVRVGAGARVDLPMGGDAKYIGVNSQGLSEQRQSQERMEARAGSMGAQTLDTTSRERESGDSLRIRIAARTADMNQIVETGAAGLEQCLKIVAEWIGENPDDVKVTPNKEFGEMPLTGQSMVEMATARNAGWPISARSLHDLSRKRKITSMTFEEEMQVVKDEESQKDFPFKKMETADRAPNQVNDNNGNGPSN